MGFDFEQMVNGVNKACEKKIEGIEKNFAKKLKSAPDNVVLQKLRQAEEMDSRLYGTVEKEARRRGLI